MFELGLYLLRILTVPEASAAAGWWLPVAQAPRRLLPPRAPPADPSLAAAPPPATLNSQHVSWPRKRLQTLHENLECVGGGGQGGRGACAESGRGRSWTPCPFVRHPPHCPGTRDLPTAGAGSGGAVGWLGHPSLVRFRNHQEGGVSVLRPFLRHRHVLSPRGREAPWVTGTAGGL